MKLLLACLFSLFLFSHLTYAYNPSVHQALSGIACHSANSLLKSEGKDQISSEEIDTVKSYDGGQDTFKSLAFNRTCHWHFFNPKKEDKQGLDPQKNFSFYNRFCFTTCMWLTGSSSVNRSFVKDVAQRVDPPLSSSKDKSTLFQSIGAACHFSEDTTVPAHIVPVYHGPSPIFIGERAIGKLSYTSLSVFSLRDAFDDLPVELDFNSIVSKDFKEIKNTSDRVYSDSEPVKMLASENASFVNDLLDQSPSYSSDNSDEKIVQTWRGFYNDDVENG